MGAVVEDQEIAMTFLCGLPGRFQHLIVATDDIADDSTLSLKFAKSRKLQEEQK